MDSIICPIIRYDVLPMYDCPFAEFQEWGYEDEFADEYFSYGRYEDTDGYTLNYCENNTENNRETEWNGDDCLRCDAYKKIGPVPQKSFSLDEAERIGKLLGIDWKSSKFDVEQFRTGMDVELEHGRRDMLTNVTNDDPVLTGKIALAHLNELPDYYMRLKKMEQEAGVHFGA